MKKYQELVHEAQVKTTERAAESFLPFSDQPALSHLFCIETTIVECCMLNLRCSEEKKLDWIASGEEKTTMEAAWACATGVADSAKRLLLSFRRRPPPPPCPNPIDILKRLQRQAFSDIMQLRERQEKVERVLMLYKSSKSGPFAEESTQFVFHTSVRKKDSLLAELVTDHRCLSSENDPIGSPFVLSKVMYLANINDSLSVAAVPVGARCDDFSTDPNLQEGHWLPSFHYSLRPPLLIKRHNYAAGVILRSKNFAASLAELISTAGKPNNSSEASRFFTGFGQVSCQMHDEIKLIMSAAWHGPSLLSRKNKPSAGGCIDFELKIDEDSRIGAWIEVKRTNPRSLRWALTLSDTPEDDLGWGVSFRRGTEGHAERVQLEGFLNFHLGKKAILQPGLMFNIDGRRCAPAVVFQSSWFL
ncbi:hypothetical protein GUJ93_ZPchr0012g19776 [Zizania palustris]|uniref:Uncharacterized protein n=1 Tax=Zizania palustris TaxID=103762 RepID=A0A8J5WMQ4_ZIZPA|nr:hypothetical protein GUJ93_ZPchr0012g19776 [Zizania palustris]